MKQGGFFDLVIRQLRGDLAVAPQTVPRQFTDAGRAERCVNVAELRSLARRRVPGVVFGYIDGGAWDEITAERNQADLRELAVLPRVLTAPSDPDLSTAVLGQRVEVPLLGAPTGMTGLADHSGEIRIARAVHVAGGVYALSSAASRSVEELAALSPGPTWFQLYVSSDRGFTREMLAQARAAGEAGARRAMNLLVDELRLAMTLAGCGSISELDHDWIAKTPRSERSTAWSIT